MRINQYIKKDFYFIGRFLGEAIYFETLDEKKAEYAEKLLAKLILDSDLKEEFKTNK